jgi:signal transduction histidine kinase
MLAVTAGSTVGVYHANRAEERKLLHERASEVALILTDSFGSLQTLMSSLAATTALNGADAHAFRLASMRLLPSSSGGSAVSALVRVGPAGGATVVARIGSVSSPLPSAVTAAIQRAATVSPPAVTSTVFGSGKSRTVGFAYTVGTRNEVVYLQYPLDFASQPSTASQPFHELRLALYAGPRPDPALLLLTTNGPAPSGGSVASATAPFGADTWLVTVQATSPLTGSFAAQAYWLVLITGLVLTILLVLLVGSLLRRRNYALEVVAERTQELQQSLRHLEEAQEQLVNATRLAAVGELASAVGHELRNPLGVITNAHFLLRSALERGDSGPDATRHLATAEREVGAATLIVSDLLDYARARDPEIAPVDVPELLDEVQSVLNPPGGIDVTREDPPDLPAAAADRDQLRQVLLNLVSNAFDAMPEGGTVTIATSQADEMVRIAVADRGTGMDEETRARVFEPFFTRKTRGVGLGLAVTKRIVDAHRGVITLETTPGEGTTFTVELPAAESGGQ